MGNQMTSAIKHFKQEAVRLFDREIHYLLQAYKADPTLVQKYKGTIMNCANNIIKKGFGTKPHPNGNCDAFTPSGNSVDDQMTAYVNRLSVLLLAIEMTRPTQSKRKASIEQT